MEHRLARRWAFMGPFQTIDMNAPQGVLDYFQRCRGSCIAKTTSSADVLDRYGGSVRDIIAQQDNFTEWSQTTITTINDAMRCVNGPIEKLPQMCQWRDAQLAHLSKHLKGHGHK